MTNKGFTFQKANGREAIMLTDFLDPVKAFALSKVLMSAIGLDLLQKLKIPYKPA